MALSDDLGNLAAFMASVIAGQQAWSDDVRRGLYRSLVQAAEGAATLEDECEQAMKDCDRYAPATIPATVVARGIRSGKVALLAAHRVTRVPDRRFGEDETGGAA